MSGTEVIPEPLSPEALATLRECFSRPNPFDWYDIDRDPIRMWRYVRDEMQGVSPAERHALLRSILVVRRQQGGFVDEVKAGEQLDALLTRAGEAP